MTVGMGPWPMDRLLRALTPVCATHDVFAQTGSSTVVPPCPHSAVLPPTEVQRRIVEADVVVTHGGNTVRLVQRVGKIPIAVAREQERGEMRNDHQVTYLEAERPRGRVIVLGGDLSGLATAVEDHPQVEAALLATAAPLPLPDLEAAGQRLDAVLRAHSPRPDDAFASHHLRRYAWAFAALADRDGEHLDLGVGDGEFTRTLAAATRLTVTGCDPHAGYLADLRRQDPDLPLVRALERLPFRDGAFSSVSMLDVLEHTPDDRRALLEVARVLRPGGLLVMTVPGRSPMGVLDPDNAKLRLPRVHAAVYRARFGDQRYRERFVDSSDGLRGDMAWERREHTHYGAADLLATLTATGFEPVMRDGANLLWRVFQVPALLGPRSLRRPLEAAIRWDGRTFRSDNLFLAAVRAPSAGPDVD